MTGRELIEYIKKWELEDCKVEVQCRDEGGYYYGTDDLEPVIIEPNQMFKYSGLKNYKRLVI